MFMALAAVGMLGLLIAVVMLIVNAIRKKRLRIWGVVAVTSVILFIVGGLLDDYATAPQPSTQPAPVPPQLSSDLLVFSDTFDGSNQGWLLGENGYFQEDALHLVTDNEQSYSYSRNDHIPKTSSFAYQAELYFKEVLPQTQGRLDLGKEQFDIHFAIAPTTRQFEISYYSPEEGWDWLIKETFSEAIKGQGEVKKLMVIGRDSSLEFYVNDVFLGSVADPYPDSPLTEIGLYVRGEGSHVVFDNVALHSLPSLPTGTPTTAITFEVSPELLPPATVGEPYSFSFASDTNPSGGNPPYTFFLGSGVGFPPFGLILDVNGLLNGTPTAAGTREFEVCVKDLSGNQACGRTSLTVEEPKVWTVTFDIIAFAPPSPATIDSTWEYRSSGEFTFNILSDGTIEGSGTAQGGIITLATYSGIGHFRTDGEGSFTTSFSVTGQGREGGESYIELSDFSPAEFIVTSTHYFEDGTTSTDVGTHGIPNIFYSGVGKRFYSTMELVDGATDVYKGEFGGPGGEISRTVTLSVGSADEVIPAPAPAPTTAITFTVPPPELLPLATVGEAYSFSFASDTNPSGGNPPYTFFLGSGVGFPPFGLILDVNGLLNGTPTAAGTREFEVCVKDLSGNQACGKTSLEVKPE